MLKRGFLGALIGLAAVASPGFAQNQPGGVGGPGNPPDVNAMRDQMNERIKTLLKASDDQWKTILPRLEKVEQAQRDAQGARGGMLRGGGRGGGQGGPGGQGGGGGINGGNGGGQGGPGGNGGGRNGGRGRRGNGGPAPDPTEIQTKTQDLQDALNDPNATPDDIAGKTRALRDARAKAKATLTAAQDDLAQVLTTRQQSVMLAMGYIE